MIAPVNAPVKAPETVAVEAAGHLAGLVTAGGQLRMGYDPTTGRSVPGHSMVRQAAAAWTMAEAAALGRPALAEAAGRAVGWMLAARLRRLPGGAACLVESKGQAKLGTAGLTLAALAALDGDAETAAALARFIGRMQKRGGDFHTLFDTGAGKPVRQRSDHYTGEALLGLLHHARWTGEPASRDLAEAVTGTLLRQGRVPQSHWMIYVLDALHRESAAPSLVAEAGRVLARITGATDYRARGECTPLAVRVEGRAVHLAMLRREEAPAEAAEAELRTDAALLMALRTADGAFQKTRANPVVQVDQLQHAAAAFLRLHALGIEAVPDPILEPGRASVSSRGMADFSKGAAWMGGRIVPVAEARLPVTDWGLTRSDAVYDVVAVKDGAFFRLDDHLVRFMASMARVRIAPPESRDEIRQALIAMVAASGLRDAYVAMVGSRGQPLVPGTRDPRHCANHVFCWCVPYIWVFGADGAERGIRLWIAKEVRRIPDDSVDPRAKNYHWGDFTRGVFEAKDAGYDTALLLDHAGNVTEGAGFNVFAVKDGALVTPEFGCLEGITRDTMMRVARAEGHGVEVRPLPLDELMEADEVFACTTGGGPAPVTHVDERVFANGREGPVSERLRHAYWAAVAAPENRTPVPYTEAAE